MSAPSLSTRLFDVLSGGRENDSENPGRAARSYLLNVANGACTKLAEQLASPGLVLPWLLGAIGAPAGLAGLLMPVKQAGSLAPQLLVSGTIRKLARRKWAWAAAGSFQAICLALMIPAALLLPPDAAGWSLVGLLLAFSIASGCGSVAFQDVTAKTVTKGMRGGMLANRAAIGGALTLLAGAGMRAALGEHATLAPFLILVGAAALLWAVSAWLFAAIPEPAGDPGEGRNPKEELSKGLALLRDQPGYAKFLGARALLLSVELATPFLALQAQQVSGGGIGSLGYYVFMVGLAAVLASPFWGRFADSSARTVMIQSGIIGALACVGAIALPHLVSGVAASYAFGGVFLLIGVAEAGVRLGRKTYLVDAAPKDERPLYVAFANTSIGLLALAMGTLGIVTAAFGPVMTIAVLAAMGLLAATASYVMPEADRMMTP
jgi:predicted MFS family arabinose efflux permease